MPYSPFNAFYLFNSCFPSRSAHPSTVSYFLIFPSYFWPHPEKYRTGRIGRPLENRCLRSCKKIFLRPCFPERLKRMHRDHQRWYSHRLNRDMGVAIYGNYGAPILAFPTSMGDEHEQEGQGMVRTLSPYIEQGRIRF